MGTTPPRVAASPSPDGGNCIIRDLTRRRHAASHLLMLQNPHSHRHGRRRAASKTGAGSGAKNFVYRTQQHGDSETDDASAHHQHGATETGITSAPKNCTKNAPSSPAKAITVSIPHRYKRAKAIAVSDHRATWSAWLRRPQVSMCPLPRKLACNSIGRGFNKGWKRCNPNVAKSWFEGATGELHAKLIRTRRRRCEGRRRDPPQCRWAAAGPGRTTSRRAEPHASTPGAAGVKGAGGTGGHGRASRRGTERSEAA